jgi:hypothetical protein
MRRMLFICWVVVCLSYSQVVTDLNSCLAKASNDLTTDQNAAFAAEAADQAIGNQQYEECKRNDSVRGLHA